MRSEGSEDEEISNKENKDESKKRKESKLC